MTLPNVAAYAPPILGQPVSVLGWIAIVHVQCKCERSGFFDLVVKSTPLGLSADVGVCPGCARPMHIQGLRIDPNGRLEFGIELGSTPRPAEAN